MNKNLKLAFLLLDGNFTTDLNCIQDFDHKLRSLTYEKKSLSQVGCYDSDVGRIIIIIFIIEAEACLNS
jgi:hypothetical protein